MSARANRLFRHTGLALTLAALFASAACGADAPETDTVAESPSADTVITLDSAAVRLAGIELVEAVASQTNRLVANGTIAFDENRSSVVAPRTEGRVVRVMADLGAGVQAGQVLAVLESPDVGATRAELASAQARLEVARRNYEREQGLFRDQISSEKEMMEAEGEFRVATADYNGAVARLASLGADEGQGASYSLASPLQGVVVQRSGSPGQLAGPQTNLFTVADLTHLWITTDVYERDLHRVRSGAPATVQSQGLPGRAFAGRVTYAGGVIDPATHTFKVRVELDNRSLELRPGMYATVAIETPADASALVELPEIAVQDVNGKQTVFVAGAQPGTFIVREVVAASSASEGRLSIRSGVRPGERVVANGAFQLKAELMKATFGEEEGE